MTLPANMPTDPQALLQLYASLEALLREQLVGATRQAIDGNFQPYHARALLEQVRAQIQRHGAELDQLEPGYLAQYWEAGGRTAQLELAGLRAQGAQFAQSLDATFFTLNTGALESLARDLARQRGRFLGTIGHYPGSVLRQTDDYLRRLGSGSVLRGLGLGKGPRAMGALLRDKAVESLRQGRALQNLSAQIDHACGVAYLSQETGEVVSIRSLQSYGEMATRTGMARAASESIDDRLQAEGVELFQVSIHDTLCYICAAFEGAIFRYPWATDPEALKYPLCPREIPLHPQCFPAGVLVSGPRPKAATARWYEGELVVIRTASGNELSVTKNHPILTRHGWVAAGSLVKGDEVISYRPREGVNIFVDPNDIHVPAPIEQIARTFFETSAVPPVAVPVSAEDFHGDGKGSDICVIATDSLLGNNSYPGSEQPFFNHQFFGAFINALRLLGLGASLQVIHRALAPAHSGMGISSQCHSLFWGGTCQSHAHSFGAGRSSRVSRFFQSQADSHRTNPEMFSNGLLRHPAFVHGNDSGGVNVFAMCVRFLGAAQGDAGLLQAGADDFSSDAKTISDSASRNALLVVGDNAFHDCVIEVVARKFAGHVYNLETKDGWYLANNIITHNCRHRKVPEALSLLDTPPPTAAQRAIYQMDDRELYAHMRDDVPGGKEMMQGAKQGYWTRQQWDAAKAQAEAVGVDVTELRGPRAHLPGIEGRRKEATRRMLQQPGLSYGQAMGQVTGEMHRDTGRGLFAERDRQMRQRIRNWYRDPQRVSPSEVDDIRATMARAEFSSDISTVRTKYRGYTHAGITTVAKMPSLDYHLVKRVAIERQWSERTTAASYLDDLRAIISNEASHLAVYERHNKMFVLAYQDTARVLPAERLGEETETYAGVFYEVDRGIITSGYQFSSLDALNIDQKALRWIR